MIGKKLKEEEALVGVLTETFTTDEYIKKSNVEGYVMYNKMRVGETRRGGAMVIVLNDGTWRHKKVHESPDGSLIESITVKLIGKDGGDGGEENIIYVTALYARPGVIILAEQLREALPLGMIAEGERWVVCSDMNAHHELWDSFVGEDMRGGMLVEFMMDNDLLSANHPEMPTRTAMQGGEEKKSSPDVVMCRGVDVWGFETEQDAHSDHNWVKFRVDGVQPGSATKRRFWSSGNAKWSEYEVMVDEAIKIGIEMGKRMSVERIEDIMYHAMRKCVPKTRHMKYEPLWTERMTEVQKEYEGADKEYRVNPTAENLYKVKKAKVQMIQVHKEERRRVFWEKYQDVKKTKDVWRLLRVGTGRARAAVNSVVTEEVVNSDGTKTKKEYKTDREKAAAFVKKFAKVSKQVGPDPPRVGLEGPMKKFTMDEFRVALKKTPRRKAVGPGEIPVEAVDHLSDWAKGILLEAMNWTYARGEVPIGWRQGWIIPVLKPGKKEEEIGGYRPVTLTSQVSKVMERMIARRVLFGIGGKLHHSQYGFRAGLSTTDALMEVVDEIVRAFDEYVEYDREWKERKGLTCKRAPQRAIAVLADFSSAFDTIGHCEVMQQLEKLGCGKYEMRWIRSFISGREGRVKINDESSAWTRFEAGVPQGTVLGPLLFIVALDDLLRQISAAKLKGVAFADDLTIVVRRRTAEECVVEAQRAMDIIDKWTEKSCMKINIDKTFGILFSKTQGPAKMDKIDTPLKYKGNALKIFTHDVPLKYEDSRLLGMYLDRGTSKGLDFHNHAKKVLEGLLKARQAVALLSGTTFGADTKQLVQFHNSLARSRELYGVEVYWDILAEGRKEKICGADSAGLRRATGLMPKSSRQAISYEARLRPLEIDIKIKQAIYYERVVRQGGYQTRRALRNPPEKMKGNNGDGDYQRVPMDACREAAYAVLEWAGVKVNRMEKGKEIKRVGLVRVSSIPPWARDNENIKINTHMMKDGKIALKKELTMEQQHALVVETADRLLQEAHFAFWTDGSSHVKMRVSGAAAIVMMKERKEWVMMKKEARPAGAFSCSFTAENVGIDIPLSVLADLLEADERAGRTEMRNVVGLVDCQSLLMALESRSIDVREEGLERTWKFMLRIGKVARLTLQHIFSHCGYDKSDEVDREANKVAWEGAQSVPNFNDNMLFNNRDNNDRNNGRAGLGGAGGSIRESETGGGEKILTPVPLCGGGDFQKIFHGGGGSRKEVDEEVLKMQRGLPVSFRDSRALIKAWGRAKIEEWKSYEGRLKRGYKKTKEEEKWTREEQVMAAQLRSGNVRIVGEWPRGNDPYMSESCQFCAAQDHKKKIRAPPPRRMYGPTIVPQGCGEDVTCGKCKRIFTGRSAISHFNRHLTEGKYVECKNAHPQGKMFIKDTMSYPKENPEEAEVVRDPSTGPVETLDHIFECMEVRKKFGTGEDFYGKVKVLCRIKAHLEEVQKKENEESVDKKIRGEVRKFAQTLQHKK